MSGDIPVDVWIFILREKRVTERHVTHSDWSLN